MSIRLRRLPCLLAAASAFALPSAQACGTEPYLGAICTFGFNFCPRGWAPTNGQLMSISQNSALFALLGTTYGGDGRTTFALPDLQGRVVVGVGQGPGLSHVSQGERAGSESVTLTSGQMPAHTHAATASVRASTANGNTDNPANAVPAKLPRSNIYSTGVPDSSLATATVTVATAGGSQPVPIRNPYLGMTTCIAIQGIFPSRD